MRVRKLIARSLAGALGLLLALSLVLVPAAPALADTPPSGHVFSGNVTFGSESVGEGTPIIASVPDGPEYPTETDADGNYHLIVEADYSEKAGASAGDLIEFYVDGDRAQLHDVKAGEWLDSYPFEIGGYTAELDLKVPDTTAPAVTVDDITDYVNVLAQISGTANDNIALDKVQVSIENTTDNVFWNGTDWPSVTEVWLDATGTETWTYTMPALTSGESYQVRAEAIDTSANESTIVSDSFTFDTTAPTVESTLPVADAIDVVISAPVTATFDEDIQAGANFADITISEAGVVSASIDGATLTIAHDDFASLTSYTVTIPAGAVEDLAGNPNAEISWSFTSVTITFIITASAGANGTIDPVGEVEVIEGDDQLFTIAPAEGYEIDDVLVDEVSALDDLVENTYTFLDVAAIHTIAASFVEIPPTTFIITASAGANGTIDPVGEVEVIEGDDQLFTIAPAEGYEIDDVLVDEVSALDDLVENTYTFLDVAAIHTIAASFVEIPPTTYALTMATAPEIGGTATDMTDASPYEEGAEVSIKAVVEEGYHFVNWTATAGVILAADAEETTFTMPAEAATVTANFELIPPTTYALTMAAAPEIGGTATDETGLSPYEEGASVSIKAVVEEGYHFVNWTATAGTFVAADAEETTFTMPAEAATVTANFALIGATYNLTVVSTDGGEVTIPGEGVQGPYDPGAEVPLLAVADEGYEFIEWTGDTGTIGDVTAADTVIIMTGDYEITGYFAEEAVTYTLFVSSSDGGSVTIPGEGTFPDYAVGTVVNLLAEPDDGYELDSWTGDVADANAVSTTITMNDDEVVHANFIESLGDLVDGTDPDGTLVLPAGNYAGDIIIDEPITITGIEGETIISGGITILELTGSNVTIENLTITDYTDFGIRIVKVRDVDTFTIRNNTIQGVEGSIIGIEVVEVEAGGTLIIEENSISGNEIGIKLLADVNDAAIHYNDITGNTVGLETLAVGSAADAGANWWNDISGPEVEDTNPGGIGDKVVGDIPYEPWLTREFQTVLDDNIAYFGYASVWLETGWNIISTPVDLDPAADTWGEYVALGDGLDIHATSPAYRFDALNQEWVLLTDDDALEPCDAIYVRMASDGIAAILYSPDLSVPSKELYSGWNLISLAWIEGDGMPANEALVTVEQVTGGLTGYKLVVSTGMNVYENSWIYIAGNDIDPWDPHDFPPPDGWMIQTSGYWVFMLNDGTLAGFTFTPVSLGM